MKCSPSRLGFSQRALLPTRVNQINHSNTRFTIVKLCIALAWAYCFLSLEAHGKMPVGNLDRKSAGNASTRIDFQNDIKKPGVVVNICHPSTGVIEQAGFLGVTIQPMEASLSPPEQRGWLSNNDIWGWTICWSLALTYMHGHITYIDTWTCAVIHSTHICISWLWH